VLLFLENKASPDPPSSSTAWDGVTGPALNADFSSWKLDRYRHALKKREIAQSNSVPETVLESSELPKDASEATLSPKRTTRSGRFGDKVHDVWQKLREGM
jgi:hypothetical protein